MNTIIWVIIGCVVGICFEKLFQSIFRSLTFHGYLVLARSKSGETESIFADLNIKPEEIKPRKWIWMRTQEIILKEEDK